MSIWAVLRQIPLIGILAVVYLILAYVSQAFLEAAVFSVTLPSGAVWVLTVADLLIVAGIVLLYMEVLKSTRTTRASVADHVLSLLVFVACLLLFLLVGRAGTSTFFLIMLFALIDVIAGFTVTITGARRDIDFDAAHL